MDEEGEKRLEKLRKTLRKCCGQLPVQNLCDCRGKSDYEVACKICRRRTGALPTRFQAAVVWNEGDCPDRSSKLGYEIHSQEWGWEYVNPRKLKRIIGGRKDG